RALLADVMGQCHTMHAAGHDHIREEEAQLWGACDNLQGRRPIDCRQSCEPTTISPTLTGGYAASSCTSFVANVSVPPLGIASRRLMARFSRAFSSPGGSIRTGGSSAVSCLASAEDSAAVLNNRIRSAWCLTRSWSRAGAMTKANWGAASCAMRP